MNPGALVLDRIFRSTQHTVGCNALWCLAWTICHSESAGSDHLWIASRRRNPGEPDRWWQGPVHHPSHRNARSPCTRWSCDETIHERALEHFYSTCLFSCWAILQLCIGVGSPCHVPCPHNVSVDLVHRVLSRARASHAMTMRMRVVNCPQKVRTRDGRKEAHRLAQAADRRTCRNSRAPTASTCMAQTRTRSDLTSSSAMRTCCERRVDVFVVASDVG